MKRPHPLHPWGHAPRPFVAFAATSEEQALRLYRSQNLIWAWLGIAAILNAAAYFWKPSLGPVVVTTSPAADYARVVLFALGGALITGGVWTIRRQVEILGHVFFALGALLNVVATLTLPVRFGNVVISVVLLLGLAATSGFRAYYIIRWIESDAVTNVG